MHIQPVSKKERISLPWLIPGEEQIIDMKIFDKRFADNFFEGSEPQRPGQ
jgi:hypothetical protein